MEKYIPLSVPNLKGNEIKYVSQALETQWVSTAGSFITEFEQKIGSYVGTKDAVACQSGTAGIHLALMALGVTQGDEVIVPTLTFIAAVNPVKYVNAEPIFMDCDDSLTMDCDKLEEFCQLGCELMEDGLYNKFTKKRIKAVIIVHVFGNMADMERINGIAEAYHLQVIEDATEALGTYYKEGKYKGKFAGAMGDIGVYSFNGNKIITTGGGGMIVSNNMEITSKCRYLSTQAKDDSLYFVHNEIGYNYRMTNLQAALGIAQLEQLENFITIKKTNYYHYIENGIELLDFNEDIRPNYWFYSFYAEKRDKLLVYLEDHQIQARPIWKLIHTLKPYDQSHCYKIEKAEYFYKHILNIPCSSNLEPEDVDRVTEAIYNFNNSVGG